ncbi:hypothetical protein Stsp02_01450 [Streptomyces sp. NBRC 14336]|nr:hypothetical protein Stsp02_01450 [Streptomyces sp. NBRC 14336]
MRLNGATPHSMRAACSEAPDPEAKRRVGPVRRRGVPASGSGSGSGTITALHLPTPARPMPIPPVLVTNIRAHVDTFGTAEEGRVFGNERGGVIGSSTYWRVWEEAREHALPPERVAPAVGRTPASTAMRKQLLRRAQSPWRSRETLHSGWCHRAERAVRGTRTAL